tara:strand:+ start:3398 stop:3706 length:309 start_codon:yes stop_codon:yes gene_type:complete
MTDIQDISEEEAVANLPFLLTMTERNRTVWRIRRKDGATALLTPVIQSGPPVDNEVLNQVEEFRKEFITNDHSKLATSQQKGAEEALKTSATSASQETSTSI